LRNNCLALSGALACGSLTALALPRPGLCLLAWFSLTPLFALWRRSSGWRQAALLGLAAGFGFHGTALYWIYSTCRFAGLAVFVGVLAWASLAFFMALNWGLIGALGRWAEPKGALRPWAWAAVWTAVTFACERWTPRLCIDMLGYTQWRFISLLQVSSLAGPHFLGFVVVAANAVGEGAWDEFQRRKIQWINPCAILLLIAGSLGYGFAQLARRSAAMSGSFLRVEILQPVVDQYQKFDALYARRIQDNFAELLSRPRAGAADLVVWPETCLPDWVMARQGIPQVAAWARKLKSFQLVGAVSQDRDASHNSAFLISPEGQVQAAYHKRQLVPFGEFVPFKFLGRFIGILDQMGGLAPGAALQPLFETPLGTAAAGICYEAAFPRLARSDAARGARLVFNLTNDGWYKDTWGPYQHFGVNIYRAIENRVTVVRCGNTGISAVIDPWGVVTAQLALGQRGRLDARVPSSDPFPRRSFYARHGDWFGGLCLMAMAALVLAVFWRP